MEWAGLTSKGKKGGLQLPNLPLCGAVGLAQP